MTRTGKQTYRRHFVRSRRRRHRIRVTLYGHHVDDVTSSRYTRQASAMAMSMDVNTAHTEDWWRLNYQVIIGIF